MAGHSKWKNIQHRKGAQDAKRGKIFTKLIKEIVVAVKTGGPDADSNPRLRLALQNAKGANMPKDNIERAIKKASGDDDADYVEVTFEGYGPDGIAIFVEATTDNNMRTVANVRSYFNKFNGSLGKDGCLQFIFDRKGVFTLNAEGLDEEEFMLEMIDAGAEDVEFEDGIVTITTEMEDFGNVQKALSDMDIEPTESGLQRIPTTNKKTDAKNFQTVMKLIDKLEDDDDVQKVYHNIEFDEALFSEAG
ncbi:MAG: YebC/PmpR family DNA-binding transcriptional regulator [Deltaproteobacteria bacterium]|nr:YebC/PmpR family DNA-binding transcriptional regulator [Deltaproteobacteria bacterium]MBU48164.1 YebC/PmpR family DNA-binding transcriptional regulator [Deltaproteobacteria bacterium]|tara:strand:- start:2501 stop:3244 length:744 start_codon:yes stop_codon:yes gene_type:complete